MNMLYIFASVIFWFTFLGVIDTIGYCGVNTWQFWVIVLLILIGKPFVDSLYKTK
jgi:hypothetical protein